MRKADASWSRCLTREAAALADIDGLRLRPAWSGRGILAALVGRGVRLRFRLTDAKLYAFQVRP